MSMDKIAVAVVSLLGIAFTYWFFLAKKGKAIAASDSVDIVVDGGYTPEVISIPKGKTIKLNFRRTDPTACLEEVVLGDFNVRRRLPLNETVMIELTPSRSGEFVYNCGMGMYHGKIIVK